jgi:DHA2 family methylenomycin A resistance protein-like MFS transporter
MYAMADPIKRMAEPTRRSLLFSVAVGGFLAVFDGTVANIIIPSLHASFGSNLGGLAWVVEGYALSFASFILAAGRLSDRFGSKLIYLSGLGLFVAASVICGVSPTIGCLIVARVIQGFGAALFVPSSFAIIRHSFDSPALRNKALGTLTGLAATASALGPIIGGLIVEHLGWRSAFLINLPIGICALWAGAVTIPSNHLRSTDPLELRGQLFGAVALAGLAFTLSDGPISGWGSLQVLAGLAIGAAAAVAFTLNEIRSPAPLIPLRLIVDAGLGPVHIVGFVLNLGYFAGLFALSLYLQLDRKLSPGEAGLALAPLTVVLAAGNMISGRVISLIGAVRQMEIGLAIGMLGFLSLLFPVYTGSGLAFTVALTLIGAGSSLTIPAITANVFEHVAAQAAGAVSALINVVRQVGTLIGVAAAAGIVSSTPDISLATAAIALMSAAMYGVGALLLACGPASRALR